MTVSDIVKELRLKVLAGANGLDKEITGGYASDLLSDVMGNADAGKIWITLQTHKNVIAVASLKDLSGVLLVNGLKPNSDMAQKSNEEKIPVLGTNAGAFEIAGEFYKLLEERKK